MKIVIVGDGKVGYALTRQLSREEHDIVVIDSNPEVLQQSLTALDVLVVHGNGASYEVQTEAGVPQSDLLIAATSADEINLLCCMLARKLGCRNTIARVRNPEYTTQLNFLRDELGLSMVVNPELATAREIYRLLQFPSFLKRDAFCRGRVELVELIIKDKSPLADKRLDQLDFTAHVRALICAVERDGKVTIPRGDFTLRVGDKITVAAVTQELAKLIRLLKINTQKARDIMLIGGSRIAVYLSEMLLASGLSVKLIEMKKDKCLQLSEKLPGALIIQGDGTQQDILNSENIRDMDAVVTLTDMDEENLIVSMYANHVGVPKCITKINRIEYAAVFKDKGIDSVVSPKLLTTNDIVRYVRAMGNAVEDAVLTLYKIVDDKAEALEFRATQGTMNLNIPLAKLRIKPNILIATIVRADNKVVIPGGQDAIRLGDTVIIVTTTDRVLTQLNDIFIDGGI